MSIISTQGITLCQETPQTSITNQDLEVSEATSSSTLSLEWLTSYTTVCNHGNLLNCYRADYFPQKKSKAINRNNYLEDHHHFWNIHQTSVPVDFFFLFIYLSYSNRVLMIIVVRGFSFNTSCFGSCFNSYHRFLKFPHCFFFRFICFVFLLMAVLLFLLSLL